MRLHTRGLVASSFVALALGAGALAETSAPSVEHYILHCSGCHGLDADGIPEVAPSLDEIDLLASSDAGRAYLVRVPGVAQAALTDADLARLLNHLVERIGGAPPEPPYGAAEVGALRASPLRDPVAARPATRPDSGG